MAELKLRNCPFCGEKAEVRISLGRDIVSCTNCHAEMVGSYINIDSLIEEWNTRESPIVNRWIPCSERLPEKAGEYLVTYHPCYWDDVEWSKRCVGIDTFRGKSTWAKKKYQCVIAWMPKPDAYEPPEEE